MSPDARKAWARLLIQRAPGAPVYGSPEFMALEDGPERTASVVKAAEAWLTEQEDELERLRVEHLAVALEQKREQDAQYVEQRDQWSREWGAKSWRPHPANRRAS